MNVATSICKDAFNVDMEIYYAAANVLGMVRPTLKQLKSQKDKEVFISSKEMQHIKNYDFSDNALTVRLAYLHFVLIKLQEHEFLEQVSNYIREGVFPIQTLEFMEQSLGIVVKYTDGTETFKSLKLMRH